MKINIGDKFVPRSKGPWPKTEPVGTVIDIKDGWVRYSMGGLITDLQEPLDNFLKLFSLLP